MFQIFAILIHSKTFQIRPEIKFGYLRKVVIHILKEKGFYRGVNLGGWLSQCDYSEERLNYFITESDFEKIASWGLDHVRIPVDYNILENADGTYKEDGFDRIAGALTFCRKYHLNMVIDLHKTAGFSFDDYSENEHGFFESVDFQERFYRLWEEIARHFGTYSDCVAFELLNEVTDKSYITVWNQVVRKCIARIRKIAPDTLILVGSYWNNSASAVKDLDPPFDDKVIYNMHCYEPLKFTHQGAYWTDMINREDRVSFTESGSTPEFFDSMFASAIQKAQENHTELYCGEYGVIDIASPEDTLAWYQTIHSVFEKYGIARCAWSYKEMDFGLSDSRMDTVREELMKNL